MMKTAYTKIMEELYIPSEELFNSNFKDNFSLEEQYKKQYDVAVKAYTQLTRAFSQDKKNTYQCFLVACIETVLNDKKEITPEFIAKALLYLGDIKNDILSVNCKRIDKMLEGEKDATSLSDSKVFEELSLPTKKIFDNQSFKAWQTIINQSDYKKRVLSYYVNLKIEGERKFENFNKIEQEVAYDIFDLKENVKDSPDNKKMQELAVLALPYYFKSENQFTVEHFEKCKKILERQSHTKIQPTTSQTRQSNKKIKKLQKDNIKYKNKPKLDINTDKLPNIAVSAYSNDQKYHYRLTKLPKDDMHAYILGHITNCCQSIGQAGESTVVDGILSANSGFYVLLKASAPKN